MQTLKLINDSPARLDVALQSVLPMSRSKLQKAIKDGKILVDGETTTPHAAVSSANAVTYDPELLAKPDEPTGTLPALDIISEDADVVVVNKPAGILSHAAPGTNEYTLADALMAHCPGMDKVGDDPVRAGLVHRLDRDASGVVVAAKTREAFLFLKRQFSERATTKRYAVLVLGELADDAGTISFPIARSVTHGRMAARPASQDGREAVTHFDVVERLPHATLLDVTIETGRTHQIRAHFFALQHPVVGDMLYTQKGLKQIDIGRLFLHARELTITLPSGIPQTFTAPLPQELTEVLERMRQTGKKH
ncbi:RluA family pseudouridine synthase [Candidatus Uhrbacteria bacterium]|nr:RluA family pseudouridine synthase [Candidatus Uhrbacteria bacterium]